MVGPRAWLSRWLLAPRLVALQVAVARELPAGGRVLDVGCGRGEVAGALAARGLEVVGVDVDPDKLAEAERAHGERVGFQRVDGTALPFDDGAFDLAVASLVLHGISEGERRAMLGELLRVARRALIMDYAVPLPRRPAGLLFRAIEGASPSGHHVAFRDFLDRGGLPLLLGGPGLSAERRSPAFDGAMELWRITPIRPNEEGS
ncbi:MAG: class I SAM-dependent methyltransferase [Pseudomonadota bacterium]